MSLDLTPSDDLTQILDAAQSMLDSHYPVARLRDADGKDGDGKDGDGGDPLAPLAEFGAFVLSLPEAEGGAGFSFVEEARLHVAFGRHLLSPGVLAASVGARVARATGQDALAEQLTGAEVAICGGVDAAAGSLLFQPEQAAFALIRDQAGLRLLALDGAELRPEPAMGQGRPLARLHAIAPGRKDLRADAAAVLLHGLLCAAQLLGVATGARDLAVEYAKTRRQFGRPIGSFQAIKHQCADMSIGVEMLSAQLDMAAIALRDGAVDAGFQIAALARLAPRIALDNSRAGIQIHGGIGFSAEADAQLYLKQAHVLRAYLGRFDLLALPAPMAPLRQER